MVGVPLRFAHFAERDLSSLPLKTLMDSAQLPIVGLIFFSVVSPLINCGTAGKHSYDFCFGKHRVTIKVVHRLAEATKWEEKR